MVGQVARAATPETARPAAARDVALQASGLLQGQVLDVQGRPQAGVQVSVTKQGLPATFATTDGDGRFAVLGLSAGLYEVRTPQGGGIYRAWAPHTAPPSAQDGVLVISGEEVVRGGQGLGFLANPWVMGAVVAAAIAIPLAMDDAS